MTPKTGDIFFADLEPVRGSEQGLERPVIVLQNPDLSRFHLTVHPSDKEPCEGWPARNRFYQEGGWWLTL